MKWSLVVVASAAFALGQVQTPQKPAPPQGAISGTVVDGATGASIPDAFVTLTAQPRSLLAAEYQNRQITDAKGRFVFLNLPDSADYQIAAGKFGFLDGGYGRDTAPTDSLRSIAVSGGGWTGGLRVNLWPPSTISGMVRNEAGEPQVGVYVRALARIRIGGRDELAAGPATVTDDYGRYRISGLLPGRYIVQVPAAQASIPAGTRLPGAPTNAPDGAIDIDDTARLVIGRYPLPPLPANGRPMTYAPAFHPAVTAPAEATNVDLRFGDDQSGIDVVLTPVPSVRVSGIVEGPAEALTSLTLRLLPAGMENLGLGAEAATALVGANGAFTFVNVPTGTYTLDAPLTFNQFTMASGATMSDGFVGSRGGSVSLPPPPPRGSWSASSQGIDAAPGVGLSTADYRGATGAKVPKLTARMSVTVGTADLTGVVVKLRPNAILRGRVLVEPDAATPGAQAPPVFNVFMDPAAGQPSLGQPRALARPPTAPGFEIVGLLPGEYFLRAPSGTGWLVKSIDWRGRDYTTTPFDTTNTDELNDVIVTVTNRAAVLTGAVRAPDGTTPASALVVIFPALAAHRVNAGLWSPRMASTPAGSSGTYRFSQLPAGDYLVAAIDQSRASLWRDPTVLSALERQASRVTLDWGQTLGQDLVVVR